jgi:hypothetical protein
MIIALIMSIIRRYLPLSKEDLEIFKDYKEDIAGDFYWYFGGDKIGIESWGGTEANEFINGFLVREDDILYVRNSLEDPQLAKESSNFANIPTRKSSIKNLSKLTDFLASQEEIHAFQLWKNKIKLDKLLIFSKSKPSNLYKEISFMPIEFF